MEESHNSTVIKITTMIIWLAILFGIIVPFTPSYVGAALSGGGTLYVYRATSRYLQYGADGLKFWRWKSQPLPGE